MWWWLAKVFYDLDDDLYDDDADDDDDNDDDDRFGWLWWGHWHSHSEDAGCLVAEENKYYLLLDLI